VGNVGVILLKSPMISCYR